MATTTNGRSPGAEIGASGLNRTAQGTVDEEFLRNLQGRDALSVFKEMSENDPVVGSVLFAIEMLIRQVEWRVDENSEAPNAEEDAQFLDEAKDDMSHSFADHISEVLTMLRYGWSWFEIVYKRRQGYQEEGARTPSSRFDDGRIGWRKFAFRAQESLDRWDFDEGGGIRAMIQKPAPKYEELVIPIQKSLLFRTTTAKGSPEGRSILRSAYRPWFYKKGIEEIESLGIERDLVGLPMAEVDPAILADTATTEQKALLAAIEKIVRNVKRGKNEGVVWPVTYDDRGNKMFDFKLLNSGGSRVFDTNSIIGRWDQRITMTTLADFILLGHEKVGSFALSSDKTDLFAVALGAWLDMIESVYNRWAVPRLFQLNGMQTEHPPSLKHGDIETPPLDKLVAYIQGLVSAGVPLFPDDELEDWLRKVGGLPEKSEEAQDAEEREEAEEEPEESEEPEGADLL